MALRSLGADQQGITIVEILIATAIIGVGLLALSSAIPIAAYGIQEGNQLSTATFLANQRMEQARNAQWTACSGPVPVDKLGVSSPSTSAPQSGGDTTFPDEDALADPYGAYSRQVRIVDVVSPATQCPSGIPKDAAGNPTTGLRQVTVTVSYRPMTGLGLAAPGSTKSTLITMYIAQR